LYSFIHVSVVFAQEWDQVISFACASLGKSLRVLREIGTEQQQKSSISVNRDCPPGTYIIHFICIHVHNIILCLSIRFILS